jgi:hypothetical protein
MKPKGKIVLKKGKIVLKVERALAKCVPVFKISSVVGACVLNGKDMFVRLPGNKWAGICNGEDIYGHLDGELAYAYTTNVYVVLEALKELKLITNSENRAFRAWLCATDDERRRDAEIERMKFAARKHGYEVKKLDTVKVKT